MRAINITLTFNGQTEAAFSFYRSVFGGEYLHLQRMNEIPGAGPMPPEEGNKILHVAFPVGPAILMGMDIPASMPDSIAGTNFMVTVDTENEAETKQFFDGLSEGGNITMPLEHQFWGAYFGMLTDKFGIQWMLSYVA